MLSALVVIEHISRYKVVVVAVIAFFVISGYWVTLVYERNHARAALGVPIFYISRAMLVFPLYLVIFLVVAALAYLIAMPLQPNVWMALPILGVSSHGKDIIGVTWSLDIELQFYLLLPLLKRFQLLLNRQRFPRGLVCDSSCSGGSGDAQTLVYRYSRPLPEAC